MQKGKQINLQK